MGVLLRFMLLCSIALAQFPLHAHADPPAVGPEVKAKASEFVAQGLAAQEAGDYDAAIGFYTKAHQLTQHPVLLFNIAQAHRLAGRIDQALAHYHKYLDQDPRGAQARTARELIAELNAEQARKAEEARKLDEERKAEEARKAEEMRAAEPRNADPTPPVDLAAAATSPPPPGRSLRIAGLATGAAGAIAFVVGIGYGVHAQGIDSELSKPMAPYSKAREAEGERANKIAIGGFISGSVLVGVGATLYLVGYRRDHREHAVTLTPVVSDQLTGLVLSGSLR